MRAEQVEYVCGNLIQDNLYKNLNSFSTSHPILGKVAAIPVSILDVAVETLKTPLRVIEEVALVILNLLGALFSEKYTIKDALANFEWSLRDSASVPVVVAIMPIKLIFQLIASIFDPARVLSINYRRYTYPRSIFY